MHHAGCFYFGFCKLHVGLGYPGGQGVGSPPPSKDVVFAKAAVSLIDTAEQSLRKSKTASEILIFMNSLLPGDYKRWSFSRPKGNEFLSTTKRPR